MVHNFLYSDTPRQKICTCSCRKCMCSRDQLRAAETYSEIHADNHEKRSDQKMYEDYLEYLESQSEQKKHVNGIWRNSLFFQFPYFETSKELSYLIIILIMVRQNF